MNQLLLVRHGQTDANSQNIVQGRIENDLNQTGKTQAAHCGLFLRDLRLPVDAVYSSPMSRARETAAIIVSAMGSTLPVIIDENLTERHFGALDGHKIDAGYLDLVERNAIPGGEKHEDLEARVFGALASICARHPDASILVVAHAHVIKSVLVRLVPGFRYTSLLANCSVNVLTCENGEYRVIHHNLDPLK